MYMCSDRFFTPDKCYELMDLAVVIDVGQTLESWNSQAKPFINRVVDRFTVSSERWTRVGVLQYGDQVYSDDSRFLNAGLNVRSAQSFITQSVRPRPGDSDQGRMLRYLYQLFFSDGAGSRTDYRHVAIIFTDGEDRSGQVSRTADEARRRGIQVIVVDLNRFESANDRNLVIIDDLDQPVRVDLGNRGSWQATVNEIINRICPSEVRGKFNIRILLPI